MMAKSSFVPAMMPHPLQTSPISNPLPAAKISASGDAFLRFSAITADTARKHGLIDTPPERLSVVAAEWYVKNVKPIPKLNRDDRRNHRLHLQIIGDILGLLPPACSAKNAYNQYVSVFNAVERKGAPDKTDIRMYCHDDHSSAAQKRYKTLNYGFYILVFAPNGAIESFRREAPLSVDIVPGQIRDQNKRNAESHATRLDYIRLLELLDKQPGSTVDRPAFLFEEALYKRSLFKAGVDGKDAWGQPVKPSMLKQYMKRLLHAFLISSQLESRQIL